MKLLVLRSGGREHDLVWKLAQSRLVTQLFVAPGNAGTELERLANGAAVENDPIGAEDIPALVVWAQASRPDFTVVGPDGVEAMGSHLDC
ncbi:MAG: hypothetical protein KF791_13070 [Verrucomicrobiae bacterium]|nr:hypothetical protein [Verrucomicrobiae bacterium]